MLTKPQNSHFYWNVAAVRAIIPDILRDEELLQPIAPGLEQYNTARHPSAATFIHGSAKSINTSAKSVEIELAEAGGATIRTVAYDHLVIATGSRSAVPGMPWKAEASYEDVVASIHRTADRVKAAEHIVVAGGGATGVEVSCELRYEFPGKQVVLLSADETLVGGDRVGPALEQALASMGVVLRKGAKAVGSTEKYGKTEVELANGETISTDLYLPTVGMIPNSEWIPDELLDERRLVKVDDCMKVTEAENVWAVGDVVGKPNPGYLMTEAQACPLDHLLHLTQTEMLTTTPRQHVQPKILTIY